jgi:hypothetical protein
LKQLAAPETLRHKFDNTIKHKLPELAQMVVETKPEKA